MFSSPRSNLQHIQSEVRAYVLHYSCCLFALSSQGEKCKRVVSGLLYKEANPIQEGCNFITPQRCHLLVILTLIVHISTHEWGCEAQTFRSQQYLWQTQYHKRMSLRKACQCHNTKGKLDPEN